MIYDTNLSKNVIQQNKNNMTKAFAVQLEQHVLQIVK